MATQLVDASANAFLTDVVAQAQNVGALNATVVSQLRGQSTVTVQITGTWVGTLSFQVTTDGTNWTAMTLYPVAQTGVPASTTTANGHFIGVVAGFFQFRCIMTAYTSGTAVVSAIVSQGTNEQQVNVGNTQASTTAGQIGPLVQGAVTTAAPTYTTAQTNPLSLTTTGGVRVALQGNAGAAVDGAIAAVPPANALQIAPKAASANPTAATAGNSVALFADLLGKLVVTPVAPRLLTAHQATAVAVTTETTIVTAGAAGVFNDITKIIVTTAVATAGTLTFRDVTAGGTPFIINYPNAALAPGVPLVLDFPVPLKQGTAASAWTITNSQAAAINVTVQYAIRTA
jgi:hypothetical protein